MRYLFPRAVSALALALVLLAAESGAEPAAYEIDPVVVTAGRLPSSFSDRTRAVTIITRAEIASSPAASVADLLDYVIGVDARQRGPYGMQADVSMRGGTFEQVLILVDGVKVADPQTGHHALDLTLPLASIERIEILRGHGSRLFGPNAFGGAINIITRQHGGRSLWLAATGGEHAFADLATSLALPSGRVGHRVSFDRSRSDGYRHNTDFVATAATYGASAPIGGGNVGLALGYSDRDFGANGFYAGRPNEHEHTRTWSASARGDARLGGVTLAPRISWRRHEDTFVLDYTNPGLYRNRHTTDVAAAEFEADMRTALGATALGGEAGMERIASTNLGDHRRAKGGVFVEHRIEPAGRFTLALGAFAYRYSGMGWRIWPGVDLGVPLGGHVRACASVGRAFRVPTYTDLYYRDPANQGNPDLVPETAWSYEGGIAWTGVAIAAEANAFRRDGRDLIDYVRNSDAEPWTARNTTEVTTQGVEVAATLRPPAALPCFLIHRIRAGYAFLDSKRRTPGYTQSKYLLSHLRHQAILDIAHALPFGVEQTWNVRWEERFGEDDHVVVDTRVSRGIGPVQLFAEATNLLGASYRDLPTVPAPGRWLRIGVAAQWEARNRR